MKSVGVHWFRRDLRILGNRALQENLQRNQGRVLGFFCFDSEFLKRPDFSHARFAFFIKTLEALKKELSERGGDLLVIDELPKSAFPKLIQELRASGSEVSAISFGRDYEPFARRRDQEITDIINGLSVTVLTARDHLLIEPHELLKADGSPYQVYSPFARRWFEMLGTAEIRDRVKTAKSFEGRFQLKWADLGRKLPWPDSLAHFEKTNRQKVEIPIPEAGYLAGQKRLKAFDQNLAAYGKDRDLPSSNGTSGLSIFLKNGSLTVPQIIETFKLAGEKFSAESSRSRFLKELAWREFYYSILYHHPRVENEAFIQKYRGLAWRNNQKAFEKWKSGMTGFPIVDAGMRQLNQTGWMHNRVRMIVASFLSKDLLIDWRWGERYFMEKLLDGDLAPNNGGWQWASSTGCDPQPYFRIFNPWLQGKKFDPEASYIKKYVPELQSIAVKEIHSPTGDRSRHGYPEPIVDHSTQTKQALKLYRELDSP